jgi:hypothetical protein
MLPDHGESPHRGFRACRARVTVFFVFVFVEGPSQHDASMAGSGQLAPGETRTGTVSLSNGPLQPGGRVDCEVAYEETQPSDTPATTG